MNYNREGEMPGPGTQPAVRAIETEQAEQAYVNQLRATEPVPVQEPSRPLTRQQLLSDYKISIRFLSKGCVVEIGCKELAFSSAEEAMISIQEYVENPKEIGDYWRGQFNMI
jgi:hypothetical protein